LEPDFGEIFSEAASAFVSTLAICVSYIALARLHVLAMPIDLFELVKSIAEMIRLDTLPRYALFKSSNSDGNDPCKEQ
jgi:hypothetical protein